LAGSGGRSAEGVGGGVVVAEPVGLAVEIDDHRAVQQSIEHRGRDGGVAQDLAPGAPSSAWALTASKR